MLGPRAQVGLLIGVLGCCGWGWAEAPWAGAPRAVAGDELDPWAGALWTGVSPLGRSEHPLPGSWWAEVPCGCPRFVPITWGIWWPVLDYGFSREVEE